MTVRLQNCDTATCSWTGLQLFNNMGDDVDDKTETTWAGKPHAVWVSKMVKTMSLEEVKEFLKANGKKRTNDITARGIMEIVAQKLTARELSDWLKMRKEHDKADRKRKRETPAAVARAQAATAKKRNSVSTWDGTWPKNAAPLGFIVERAKSGKSSCAACGLAIPDKSVRIKVFLRCHTGRCECDRCEAGQAEMARLMLNGFYHLACCATAPGVHLTVTDLKAQGKQGGWSRLPAAQKAEVEAVLQP